MDATRRRVPRFFWVAMSVTVGLAAAVLIQRDEADIAAILGGTWLMFGAIHMMYRA